jgi:hypothetical protein
MQIRLYPPSKVYNTIGGTLPSPNCFVRLPTSPNKRYGSCGRAGQFLNQTLEMKRCFSTTAPRRRPTQQSQLPILCLVLTNLDNPQEDGQATPLGGHAPPPRPPKHNVQMVYDLTTKFPNLPRRANQNPNQPNSQATPRTLNSDSQTAGSAITTYTIAQIKAEMKNEFMAMIQKEAKSQIQTHMQALQTEPSATSLPR